MAITVNAAFEQFRANIEPPAYSQADATARKDAIVNVLKNSHLDILDSFRTGSLYRETGIRDYADLDIMVVLHYGKHCKDKTPAQVLDAVRRPLANYRESGVRRDGQAITLKYTTWPNVDVVPAYKNTNSDGSVNHYGIPDTTTGTWIKTRPRLHDTRMRDANASCGPEFKRIVKMIKWWNVQNGASLLRSYHIEVMALKASFGPINGDYPWFVFNLFEKMRELVEAGLLWYEDAFADSYLTAAKRKDVASRGAIQALEQQAAGADGRVVDLVALLRLEQAGHQPADLGRRIELAASLAGRGRELGDQPLVGLAEHVGGDALVRQRPELVEVRDDPGEVIARERHLVVEVGALEDAGELLRVRTADRRQRVVQRLPLQRLVGVADVSPAVARGHLQDMEGAVARELRRLRNVAEVGQCRLRLLLVDVGGALEEEQREDVVLLVRDLVAKEVCGLPEVILELAQAEHRRRLHGCHVRHPRSPDGDAVLRPPDRSRSSPDQVWSCHSLVRPPRAIANGRK